RGEGRTGPLQQIRRRVPPADVGVVVTGTDLLALQDHLPQGEIDWFRAWDSESTNRGGVRQRDLLFHGCLGEVAVPSQVEIVPASSSDHNRRRVSYFTIRIQGSQLEKSVEPSRSKPRSVGHNLRYPVGSRLHQNLTISSLTSPWPWLPCSRGCAIAGSSK